MAGFGKGVQDYSKRTDKAMRDIFRRAVIIWFVNTVMRTPVNTGRARSNWQVSDNVAATGTIDVVFNPVPLIQAHIESSTAPVLVLTNNLPYIQRLENGWSAQAPAGMVKLSLVQASAYLRSALP